MVIRIGTDCSGIEAPIEALRQLKIEHEHIFTCEKDKYALQSIKANYTPKKIYTDITKRKHALLPDIDIYVCGFPCQPFSLMGNKKGTTDPRSNIMYQCIKVITKKRPKVFILENVKNFKYIEEGKPFKYLMERLNNIGEYNVYNNILNTKDYGIPQNRERIYIIGIRKDIQREEYTKPKEKEMISLEEYIIDKTIYDKEIVDKMLKKNLEKINNTKDCIVLPFTYYFPMKNISPTLTTQCGRYYLTTYKRNLSAKECLLLQGFRKEFKQVVSNTQMYKQAGNSMSVNVIKEIYKKIFEITTLNPSM